MDLETAIQRIVGKLIAAQGFMLPITVSSVAANGGVLCTRFETAPTSAPRGTATLEHIAGDVPDDGFAAPIHMLFKDAAGRVALWRQGPMGEPTPIELVANA